MEKKEEKKTKKNAKQLSITIPPDIYAKLELLEKSTPISTTSGLISKILLDFFNNSEYVKNTIQLDSNAMLIPVNLYREVEGISPIGLAGRIEKGLVKIQRIGLADYVVEDEKSVKNIYLRLSVINKLLKESNLLQLENYSKFSELENSLTTKVENLEKIIKSLKPDKDLNLDSIEEDSEE